MNKDKLGNPIELIIMGLTDYEINGEELEILIRGLGMENQMLRQLVMKADVDVVEELIREKEELERNKTKVHCVTSFKTAIVDLMYKGIEYSVEIKYHSGINYTVSDSVTGDELHSKAPIVDEIITYIEENVDLEN
jgi:hypothetical protein